MKEYYEVHITMDPEDKDRIYCTKAVESHGWTFSAIAGDPDLGPGLKCYATKQFNKKHSVIDLASQMNTVAKSLKDDYNMKVLRRKIEVVVHDDRSETYD